MISGFESLRVAAVATFVILLIAEPLLAWLMRLCGFYAIVEEGTCHVYILFGRVISILTEPGLYFLWLRMGPLALIVNWFGTRHILDMRLDQSQGAAGYQHCRCAVAQIPKPLRTRRPGAPPPPGSFD